MAEKETKPKAPEMVNWVKKDGKTKVKTNALPENIAKAEELGWKKVK